MYIDYNSMPDDEFEIAMEDDGFDDYPDIPMPLNCCTEGCNDAMMSLWCTTKTISSMCVLIVAES